MDKAELLALAERVEGLAGPDREVDALIGEALSVPYKERNVYRRGRYPLQLIRVAKDYQKFTASLDAAMTLVPEGWVVGQMSWWPHAKSATTHMDDMHGLKACSGAVSLPLAICAAALRAHASAMEGEG